MQDRNGQCEGHSHSLSLAPSSMEGHVTLNGSVTTGQDRTGQDSVCVCVCVCVCLESLPNKEGGRERVHCTMSQQK